jgi:uncharacterized phiE125 gp8 family phage protein
MSAILIVPPIVEPASIAELKALLRVVDSTEDAILADLISAARLHLEALTRRVFVEQTWRICLDRWPISRMVVLPIAPAKSLQAVTLVDALGGTQNVPIAGFMLDQARVPGRLIVPSGVGSPGAIANGIRIDLVAGYGAASDVPVSLKEAVLRLAASWYAERAPGPATAMPETVEALIAPYRILSP